MEVVLKNTADYVLQVPLNSGPTIQLAPGEATKPLRKLEVINNRTIKKLEERGCISMMEQKVVKSAKDCTKKK